jgi:hypothetical protein
MTKTVKFSGRSVMGMAPIGQRCAVRPPSTRKVAASSLLFMLAVLAPCGFAQTRTTWKWTVENVDASAQFTSLAVDSEGNVHVAYAFGSAGYDLKYAFRASDTAKWFNMLLEKEYSSYATNISVDPSENPHICLTPREVKYASWDGKTWRIQQIDPAGGTAEFNCSLAFSKDGAAHLTWYQTRNAGNQGFLHIKYANLSGGVWTARTIDFDRECGKWNSVVVDSEGHPHVAYSVFPPGELKYGVFDGKDWHITAVDSPGTGTTRYPTGMGVSLAPKDQGEYFMSFYESPGYDGDTRNPGSLKVAHLVNAKWHIETVDQVFKGQSWTEYATMLELDKHGNPHISYEDGGALKHAYWDGERWRVQLLVAAGGGDKTLYSSMKIAPDDTVYISYRDPFDGSLCVAVGHPTSVEIPKSTSVKTSQSQHEGDASRTTPKK